MAKTRTVELIAKLRNNMGPGLRNLARGAAAAATAIIAMGTAAFAAAKKLSDYGAEIFDVAAATGVTVEEVQALGYAFEQTGGSMTSMSGAIRGLNTFMRTAATGSAEYVKVLDDLGLEYDALRAMEPAEAFIQITDAIGGLDSAMERNIAATTVFGGRYAQQITGALDQAGGSLSALTEQFEESGNAMSGEQITSLKKYSDAMTDLEFAMKKLTADALEPLLPKLQDMADKGITLAQDVLPALIPMIEMAIDTMVDTLPTVIRLLASANEGWNKIANSIDGIGSGDAKQLMEALTEAVRTGAITAQEASDEWAKLTRVQRDNADMAWEAVNPVNALVNEVDDLTAVYGIFRQQQAIVSQELDEMAFAAFGAATAVDTLNASTVIASGNAAVQAGAMGAVALAYSNFLTAGADADPETLPEAVFSNTNTAAEKLEMTTKQVLLNIKEYIKPLAEAKDIVEKHSEMEDALRANIIERKVAEAEADTARQNALDKANATLETFAGNVMSAALNGGDAWNAFWDNMKAKIVATLATKGLMAFLNLASGGSLGFLGGALGFLGLKGGGTVPHYSAAGGMTVPGSTTSFGDKVPIMAEAGEVVLSRNQAQDLQGGSTVNHISLSFPSIISSATSADIARAVPALKKIMEKGNL